MESGAIATFDSSSMAVKPTMTPMAVASRPVSSEEDRGMIGDSQELQAPFAETTAGSFAIRAPSTSG